MPKPSPLARQLATVLVGAAAALAGVHLLFGLGVALLVGGVAAVAFGFLVDL